MFAIMGNRGNHDPTTPAFDAFGDPLTEDIARSRLFSILPRVADRATCRIGAIAFWALVLALLAGRVYTYEKPTSQKTISSYDRAAQR